MEIPRGIEKGCEWLTVVLCTANTLSEDRGITDKKTLWQFKGTESRDRFYKNGPNKNLLFFYLIANIGSQYRDSVP